MLFHNMFIFKRKAYCGFFSAIELSAWPLFISLKIKYDQDKFGTFFLRKIPLKIMHLSMVRPRMGAGGGGASGNKFDIIRF